MKGRKWVALIVSAIALIFAAFCSAGMLINKSEWMSWIMLFVTALVSFLFIMQFIIAQQNVHRYIAEMDDEINNTERETIYNFPAPTIIIDETGKIVWFNRRFTEYIYDEDPFGVELSSILTIDIEKTYSKRGTIIEYNERNYRVTATLNKKGESTLSMLYFEDVTEYVELEQAYNMSRPTVLLIVVDNYEDSIQNIKGSESARVAGEIQKLLETFMENTKGIIRKTDNDKFVAVMEEYQLEEIIENKFKILDLAREIIIEDKTTVTLSVGVGRGAVNLEESEVFAKQALDMALGRGGDQAAVKTDTGYQFFGGVSQGVEKQTKAKTRMIAQGLLGLIEESEKVYIMGHSFGDLDSIGSAVGLAGAIHNMDKEVRVVADPEKNLAAPLIDRINEIVEDYDYFITPEEAVGTITDASLLIIVDTHSKEIIESRELYEKAKQIVIIDHHRKLVDYIENAVIFHHEPYASSASEMVAELVQYFGDAGRLSSCYAEALLAGIMLDTKNFIMRTGVRTFEAAAFLRKLGADTVLVRSLFASSIESYQKKTKLVASAIVYENCAIATSDIKTEDIRTIAPQAADELLGIAGVDAAFVIYESEGMMCYSARSMGALNVQIVMEKLGGGGHQTMAGAQLEGVSFKEARERLKAAIDEHLRERS